MNTSYIIVTDNSFDTDVKHFFKVGTVVVLKYLQCGLIQATNDQGTIQIINACDVVEVF